MSSSSVAPGAGTDANSGLSKAAKRSPRAVASLTNELAKANELREAALASERRLAGKIAYGHKLAKQHLQTKLERNGCNEQTIGLALLHIAQLFYPVSANSPKLAPLSDEVTKEVQLKFAYTVTKHNLSGLPGQMQEWFGEAEQAAREYISRVKDAKSGSAVPTKPAAPASNPGTPSGGQRNHLRAVS